MTDLVKRARDKADEVDAYYRPQTGGATSDGILYRELADRIEQLEDKIRQDAWTKPKLVEYKARIEQLENELAKAQSDLLAQQHDDARRIEQLETALQHLLLQAEKSGFGDYWTGPARTLLGEDE